METLESIPLVDLGIVPTLTLLETYDKSRRGRKTEAVVTAKVPWPYSREEINMFYRIFAIGIMSADNANYYTLYITIFA